MCAQFLRAADVIDMRVGDHDHLHGELVAIEDGDDFGNVVTRIDHNSLAADFVGDHGAVTAEHPDGQSFVNHRCM